MKPIVKILMVVGIVILLGAIGYLIYYEVQSSATSATTAVTTPQPASTTTETSSPVSGVQPTTANGQPTTANGQPTTSNGSTTTTTPFVTQSGINQGIIAKMLANWGTLTTPSDGGDDLCLTYIDEPTHPDSLTGLLYDYNKDDVQYGNALIFGKCDGSTHQLFKMDNSIPSQQQQIVAYNQVNVGYPYCIDIAQKVGGNYRLVPCNTARATNTRAKRGWTPYFINNSTDPSVFNLSDNTNDSLCLNASGLNKTPIVSNTPCDDTAGSQWQFNVAPTQPPPFSRS
jgi:Tfp pilus assembly major pilin PilA